MTTVETGTILDKIVARTRADVIQRAAARPIAEIETEAAEQTLPLSLERALRQPGVSIIAEIKRASPSRGRFPVEIVPDRVAADYAAGGAAAISVLTDAPFFQGSLDDMRAAAAVVHRPPYGLPVLRKDFIVDRYQIVEARAAGADAILLIVAVLDDPTLHEFLDAAHVLGMDALVETHDELEMARARALGATIIGINNRDLKTFAIDLGTTERLAPLAPPDAVLVAESGIFGAAEMERVKQAGASAVLVGEGLIVQPDRAAAVRALRESAADA